MKQLIVFAGLFMIFIFILLQFTANEVSHSRRNRIYNIVETHAQQARKEGYFTPQIKRELIDDLEEKLDVPASEIKLTLTETPKVRTKVFNPNELISYKVEVPIRKVVAMSQFFGLGEGDNMYWFVVEGKVSSERLDL